jgi:hypothetical protein
MGFIDEYKESEKKTLAAIAVEKARLNEEHERLTGEKNAYSHPSPRPAPAPAAHPTPSHTNAMPVNPVRRQEDIERRTAEIKVARKKEADENQAEINRILGNRDIPGMATARARQRTGEHNILEASDMENGLVIPGRISFRTGQTRQ